jgi:hypothetical protein
MSEIRRCKLCKKAMRFVKSENGSVIPLDAVAPVYEVRPDLTGVETAYRVGESIMVSHFATCPHASDFSKKGKSR